MTKKYLITLGAAAMLIGCSSGSNPMDMGPDITLPTLVAVSGISLDADLLLGTYAMNPNDTAQMLLDAAKNANAPVYGRYEDGTKTETVMTAADGTFTIMAKENSTIHMVADSLDDAMHHNMATYTNESIAVGTAPVANAVAHACTSNPYSVPTGIAAAAGIGPEQLLAEGVTLVGTSPMFVPPFVTVVGDTTFALTPADATVTCWAGVDAMQSPFLFRSSTATPCVAHEGIVGYTKAGVVAAGIDLMVKPVDPSGATTFALTDAKLIPGFVNFAGLVSTK